MKEIVRFLKESMEMVKAELGSVGITPQQFSHWNGDTEYAEDELLEAMEDAGIQWDDAVSYDEICSLPVFKRTVRWQAAYNMVA